MMTPKEVQEHGFPRSRKGYDMAEVDEFLDKLTEDYTALYTNYGKLSSSYAKLRKKAQALASALEQIQQGKAAARPVAAPVAQPVVAAPVDTSAAEEVMRNAQKDAQAIRAGAERERQEIISQATSYAAQRVQTLKDEIAAEEQRLSTLKKVTAEYVGQVRHLMEQQAAVLDGSPVPEAATPAAPASEAQKIAPVTEEPTVRMEDPESAVAEEISRSILNLQFDDEDAAAAEFGADISGALAGLDDAGSLFDAITGGEFDEE